MERFTLPKEERLCSSQLTDRLFSEGKSVSCFPLRAVFLPTESHEGLLVMFSVSKRKLNLAVDRNRVKRQLRELYRHSKAYLTRSLTTPGKGMALSFVFIDSHPWKSSELEQKYERLTEKLIESQSPDSTVSQTFINSSE